MSAKPDQSEILTENAQLDLRARALRAEIFNKHGEMMTTPAIPSNDILAANSELKSQVTMLEARLATASRPTPAPAAKAEKQTLTQRILAAKGVATLRELAALPVNNRD